VEFLDQIQRVLICQFCGIGRFAFTPNETEFCIRCGQQTSDSCPQCETPLKDPEACYCHSCGSNLIPIKHSSGEFAIKSVNSLPPSSNKIQKIELRPGFRENLHHENKVILISYSGNKSISLNNACFDFLYYIIWLLDQKHYSLPIYKLMPNHHKDEICSNHHRLGRFNAKWSTNDIRSKAHYVWLINEKLGFKLINRNGPIISISKQFPIKLIPFQAD